MGSHCKTYEAERRAFVDFDGGPHERFKTVGQIEQYVYGLLDEVQNTFQTRIYPVIRSGKGARWARGGLREIKLPLWARTEPVILHEVAHHIQDRTGTHNQRRGHNAFFRAIFVALVHKQMGWGAARRLAVEFERSGLRIADGIHY